jgi:hypothetical protein
MDVLLLTFSNHRTQPLQTLVDEYLSIDRTLAARTLRQHFLAKSISHATLKDIGYYLALFRNNLTLFLYSGHAGRDLLLTEDGPSRSEGIAHLLGQCPRLQVVILNGCSTAGQVKALHEAGIPVVIASSAPVEDESATRFSSRLFQALETGLSIEEAFELGVGETLSQKETAVHRASGREMAALKPDEPVWGIFTDPEKAQAKGWKLPSQAAYIKPKAYTPNELLLETLYKSLKDYHEKLGKFYEDGVTIEESDEVRNAILHAIPAPISEHLRKLNAPPNPNLPGGLHEPGPERLAELAKTYEICMDFLVYLFLAQLWDQVLSVPGGKGKFRGELAEIRHFINTPAGKRQDLDYFSILRELREALEQSGAQPFVEEYSQLHVQFFQDEGIRNACFFLDNLGRLLGSASPSEMPELCARAEDGLAVIFSKLGFLGRYTLATVRFIDVQKYRHMQETQFEHIVVKWHGTQGRCEVSSWLKPEPIDNRSVILVRRGDTDHKRFLNLSPFILDENTFEAVPDLTMNNLYFFSYLEPDGAETARLHYKYVNNPEMVIRLDDPKFDISEKNKTRSKFKMAMDQFAIFYEALNTTQI